ncbi:hypothetical protein GJV11_05410 [Enterobacteriaceae bacterium RIT693]|nr:hypothetical protein [Enterobacteriaceae bacterium RIT693]
MHFKNNKVTHSLWLMGVSTMGMVGGVQAQERPSSEETLIVTGSVSEDPSAPLKGMVATKTLSATKTAAELVKTPVKLAQKGLKQRFTQRCLTPLT